MHTQDDADQNLPRRIRNFRYAPLSVLSVNEHVPPLPTLLRRNLSKQVETLVDTVAATPAAVGGGFGKAKEAVSSAGELLESIPRTVEDIPVEVRAGCSA